MKNFNLIFGLVCLLTFSCGEEAKEDKNSAVDQGDADLKNGAGGDNGTQDGTTGNSNTTPVQPSWGKVILSLQEAKSKYIPGTTIGIDVAAEAKNGGTLDFYLGEDDPRGCHSGAKGWDRLAADRPLDTTSFLIPTTEDMDGNYYLCVHLKAQGQKTISVVLSKMLRISYSVIVDGGGEGTTDEEADNNASATIRSVAWGAFAFELGGNGKFFPANTPVTVNFQVNAAVAAKVSFYVKQGLNPNGCNDTLDGWTPVAENVPSNQSSTSFNLGPGVSGDYYFCGRLSSDAETTSAYALLTQFLKVRKAFVTVWKTDNAGSANNQIILPAVRNGTYDFYVDWGDETAIEHITNYSAAQHTYLVPGTYTVSIFGDFVGFSTSRSGADRLKLIELQQWGDLKLYASSYATSGWFYGASNMKITATDAPDLSGMKSLYGMFQSCGSISTIPGISNWDVSGIETFDNMFYGAAKFNDDLSGWDMSSAVSLVAMFRDAHEFNGNLSTWDVSNVQNMSTLFSNARTFNGDLSAWDTGKVKNFTSTFYGATAFTGDISGWNTASATSMAYMFGSATAFNGDLSGWNTANVLDFSSMFSGATVFAGDLSGWNTSSALSFGGMFNSATKFSSNISGWNTANVTDMSHMFRKAAEFNAPIGSWNTSKVTNMAYMFAENPIFNQPIGTWDTSSVTGLERMFYRAHAFNQNLSTWNTANVTNMNSLFYQALAFNQPVNTWNTSKVTNMYGVFGEAPVFNQPLANWDVSKVTNMDYLFFYASAFNQDISGWNTGNVTTMRGMFYNAPNFNQNISGWNTAKVVNMDYLFRDAPAFNQNLGSWNVTSLKSAYFMLLGSGLTTVNYNNLLIGWAAQTVQKSVRISSGPQYSSGPATAARDKLVNTYQWTITDAGMQ